jgi:hypothetical protein
VLGREITGLKEDTIHEVEGHTGAYAVRSNMVYLSGGRGPIEYKPGAKPAKKKRAPGRPLKHQATV